VPEALLQSNDKHSVTVTGGCGVSDQPITRRKVLAVAGSVAVAGCGSSNSDASEWGTKYATTTRQPTEGSSTGTAPSGTRTPESSVEINVDESTETPLETEEPSDDPGGSGDETPTEASNEEAETETIRQADTVADHIQRARTSLSEAVAAYTGDDNGSIGEVGPATAFETDRVDSNLASAREAVSGLSQSATSSQLDTINRIRTAAELVELLAACQQDVHASHRTLEQRYRALFDEELERAASLEAEYSGNLSAARVSLSSIRDNADPSTLPLVDGIDRESYEAKLAQFDSELSAMEDMVEPYELLLSALESYVTGVELYTDAAYRRAQTALFNTHDNAERVFRTITRNDVPGFLTDITDPTAMAAETLMEGAEELERSARYGADNNEDRREDNLRDAISILRSDVRIQRLPSTRKLRRETDV